MIHGLQCKSTLLLFPRFYYLHSVPVAFMLPHLQQTYDSLLVLLPVKPPPMVDPCVRGESLSTYRKIPLNPNDGHKWNQTVFAGRCLNPKSFRVSCD